MLCLRSISLFQFKNYSGAGFEFPGRIIGICGENGVGKTNLLDAIYSLCFTKSYFNRSDSLNVQHNRSGFRVEGDFDRNGQDLKVVSVLRENGKKEFSCDGRSYDRLAAHIGLLPAVIIAPDDVQIITGGSEDRRRYLDTLFSQLDTVYLQELIAYNKVLQQRNGYLKSLPDRRAADHSLIDIYDQQLVRHGAMVHKMRAVFLENLIPAVGLFYQKIAGKAEGVQIFYESQINQADYATILAQNREKDLVTQRTGVGIHKDDLGFLLGDRIFRNEASQGQRKSLLFALKLAEFQVLKLTKGFEPILLLDDVFEKLDESRIANLLTWVSIENEGQVFITDTHAERFTSHVDGLGIKYQLIRI
ncbi:MAG: DNA replication and repair protein RecF [Chitinophagaceae bacterium]|nr:MAG: DNA replication and repair protein RecF [Chitinophagaceae bacterium]